jgi:hypothetical protein
MKHQLTNQFAMNARQECPTRSYGCARIAHEDLPPQIS